MAIFTLGSGPQASFLFPQQPPQPTFLGSFGPPPPSAASPLAILALLRQLLGSLTQLSQGWTGFAGQPVNLGGGFGGQPLGGGFGVQPFTGGGFGLQPYNGGGGGILTQPSGGYFAPQPGLAPPDPSDPQEFASYLQAQRIGGTLEGKTGIAQRDAIPGSRFGQVQDSTMWQASVARNYAYQFAAYANGYDALTPQGVAQGAQALKTMSPDAQLFMQVASVFKGNLFNGPGFYDNPGLKRLLESRGLADLASKPGVGETDVQSIGAVAAAINRGQLSLNEVLQSGTIDNLGRYNQIIGYVQQGGFANDLRNYDSVRF